LTGDGFDVHLAAPSSFKVRAVVFSPNSLSMRAFNMRSHLGAAIERGCSIGANHAQNWWLTNSDSNTCRHRMNRDDPSTFRQAHQASIS
jgi:hypothetical protein